MRFLIFLGACLLTFNTIAAARFAGPDPISGLEILFMLVATVDAILAALAVIVVLFAPDDVCGVKP